MIEVMSRRNRNSKYPISSSSLTSTPTSSACMIWASPLSMRNFSITTERWFQVGYSTAQDSTIAIKSTSSIEAAITCTTRLSLENSIDLTCTLTTSSPLLGNWVTPRDTCSQLKFWSTCLYNLNAWLLAKTSSWTFLADSWSSSTGSSWSKWLAFKKQSRTWLINI